MPVVVTGHWHKTLGKTGKWHTDQLHSTLQDSQSTHIDIAKFLQTAVQYKAYQTFRTGHDKRRHAQSQHTAHNTAVELQVALFQTQGSPVGTQETQNPAGTAGL